VERYSRCSPSTCATSSATRLPTRK
jgi:hypothetical protein